MTLIKPNRRWLQFSLRTVLLLTLAVALWLGYEVRQARQVERTIAALRALGGDAECEPTGWSLLRLCRVPGYGQRIVRAEIPGTAVEEAIGLLRDLAELREVQVAYDGTCDPGRTWRTITDALVGPKLTPLPKQVPFELGWIKDETKMAPLRQSLSRFEDRVTQALPSDGSLAALIARRFRSPVNAVLFGGAQYHVLLLPDGTLAELLLSEDWPAVSPGTQTSFIILMVADRCVGVKRFTTTTHFASTSIVLEDLDDDGVPEVGFRFDAIPGVHEVTRKLPGDSRDWLGVYKIMRDGFKSLLPEDKSDFP